MEYLSNDLKLILECCKASSNKETINKLCTKIENWENFLNLSYRHGVLPLVYKGLKNESIPQVIKEHFQSQNLSIAKNNLLLSAELCMISRELQKNNIQYKAFKGPLLSLQTLEDVTQRQYLDLDILVRKEQVYQTAKLLLQYGYQPMNTIEFLKNEAKLCKEKNYEFFHSKKLIKIELHWKLLNNHLLGKLDNYNIWVENDTVSLYNHQITSLNFNIQLLYLCSHGTAHLWERIEWIVDIDRLIRNNLSTIQWSQLLYMAKKFHSLQAFLLGMALTQNLFHTPLPKEIENELKKQTTIQTAVITVVTAMEKQKFHLLQDTEENILLFQLYLQLETSISKKIVYIFQTLFHYSNHDIMTVNLPKKLYFLYYFIRIYRLSKKYIFKK